MRELRASFVQNGVLNVNSSRRDGPRLVAEQTNRPNPKKQIGQIANGIQPFG
jgi:hypothetical protein